MAAKRSGGTRSEMIRCPYCGEDYASSYRHCPFCDELPQDDDYEEDAPPRARGGKRLITNTRGGGYGGSPSPGRIIATILSLALIVAAVIIVITQIVPLLHKSPGGQTSPSPSPSSSVQPSSSPEPSGSAEPQPSDTAEPSVQPDPSPSGGQATVSFVLDQKDFSFSDRYPDPVTIKVTFSPAGASGTITWTSSDPDVASVDANGKVSPGTKRGSATITASLEGGGSETCLVHNTITSGGGTTSSGGASSGSGTSSSALSLNREDFTLNPGESFQVKVSGTSSTPTWSIANTAVATVSGNGTVTYVGKGSTTLTCKVDGQTLTCIVRGN